MAPRFDIAPEGLRVLFHSPSIVLLMYSHSMALICLLHSFLQKSVIFQFSGLPRLLIRYFLFPEQAFDLFVDLWVVLVSLLSV